MTSTYTDNTEKLAMMAGQIADFFKSYPEADAVTSIAEHINKFWNAQMREDFVNAFAHDGSALHPYAWKAISLIKRKKK